MKRKGDKIAGDVYDYVAGRSWGEFFASSCILTLALWFIPTTSVADDVLAGLTWTLYFVSWFAGFMRTFQGDKDDE